MFITSHPVSDKLYAILLYLTEIGILESRRDNWEYRWRPQGTGT